MISLQSFVTAINDDGRTIVALSLALVHIVYPSFGRLYWCCPLACFNVVGAGVFVSIIYHFIVVFAISDIVIVAVHAFINSVLMIVVLCRLRGAARLCVRRQPRSTFTGNP